MGGLVLSGDTLYGTAEDGNDFAGTVFSIKINGSTGFASLHSFTFDDGEAPMAGLTLVSGTLLQDDLGRGLRFSGNLFAIGTDGSNFTNFIPLRA